MGPSEPSNGAPGARGPAIGPGPVLLLAASVLLVGALYLTPDASFAYFGSDTGEYYRLVVDLSQTGHLPVGGGYSGWGTGYPDFPGMFVVVATAGAAAGVDPLTALRASIPLLAAVTVAPMYLAFRRLVPNDGVALLGAGFAAVLMPRAFSLAHPAPLALGDLLAVGGLWMFVEGRADPRWYLPLALAGGALIVTHHLSSYFFLLMALGGLVSLELLRPGAWSRRTPSRELVFLAAFGLALDLYWFAAAPDFVRVVLDPSRPLGLSAGGLSLLLGVAAVAAPVLAGLLIEARRRRPGHRLGIRFPSDASVLRDALALGIAIFGGVALLVVTPLPGTSGQMTSPGAILYFTPVLLVVPLVAGTRRLSTTFRLGPLALVWLLVVGLSALGALALPSFSAVIPATRHPEYLLFPIAAVAALALGRWTGRAYDARGPRAGAAVAAAGLLLLTANAAIVYPPPAYLGNFQEGFTPRDALLAEWAGGALAPGTVVATDHRLSSYLFGVDGDRATWGSTYPLFCGTDRTAALTQLAGAPAPTALLPIGAVAIDGTMRSTGVALDPAAQAVPISPEAAEWLAAPPFLPIYENQGETVAWVAGSGLPSP